MLNLFILRHAQADNDFTLGDNKRELTQHGINQARLVAKHLPDIHLAFCSSATRTQMTLKGLLDGGTTIQKVTYADELYNSSSGTLLSTLQSANQEQNLLIVAHNPGIHQLADMLALDDDTKEIEQIRLSYAPATLTALECPIDRWKDLKPAENKLVNVLTPD